MRIIIALAGAAVLLVGCGRHDTAPIKRQPGSWSQKIEILDFAGPGITPGQKTQMQQMMNMMSNVSVCVTPEAAAREDIERNLTSLGGQQGNCVVDSKDIAGTRLAFVATCKDKGKDVRITADGTNGATEQTIKMTVETVGATKDGGRLVMTIAARRTGACKPGDITPPAPPAAAPAKAAS